MEDNNNPTAGLIEETEYIPRIPKEDEFLMDDEWYDVDITNDWLDPTKAYEKPKYTLSYRGVKFAPLGGIHALTGQPGNGKTMTFAQFMVAILNGEWYDLKYELKDLKPNPTVLYIDTEMEEGNTQLVQLRVYEMMGWHKGVAHDNFKVIRLRETDRAEDRWRKTLKAIYELKDTLVVAFIDGLLDVVSDFNKNDECQDLIYKCMKTASHYGISLWCLVHENPGSTKMVGHLGSMLERKVTDAFGTVKEKKAGEVTFTIVQKKARNKDLEDIVFQIEDGPNGYGIPAQVTREDVPIESIYTTIQKVAESGLQFPATAKEIKDKIRDLGLEKNTGKLQSIIVKSKNKLWLIEQEKEEFEPGQNHPKLKLADEFKKQF